MNEETPSIFTSYNQQEAEDDVQILKSLGAIVDENAWRGGRAHLDYFTEGVFCLSCSCSTSACTYSKQTAFLKNAFGTKMHTLVGSKGRLDF